MSDVHVHIDASGAFPELTRRDQVRGLLTGVGGVKRMNGPPAAILVGKTRHGRPIALEVNLNTIVVAIEALALAYRDDIDGDRPEVVQAQ